MSESELCVDPERQDLGDTTGIYVRATLEGKWGTHDLAELTRESVLDFLRSRGGDNPWAEGTVLLLLGHPPLVVDAREGQES